MSGPTNIRLRAMHVKDALIRVHNKVKEFEGRKIGLSDRALMAEAQDLAAQAGAGSRAALLALLESTELIHARLDALESGTDD